MQEHKISKRYYLAYLLRLWKESDTATWRVTLENPHTGCRHAFSDLKKLFAFLEEKTSEGEETDAEDESESE
jgi:hypothetical protein